MTLQLQRKGAVGTIGEAFEWLKRNPALILAFLVIGLVNGLSEEVAAFSFLGLLLTIAVRAVAHRIAFAEARGESTTIGDEVGPVLSRYLSLLGAWILYTIAVVVGLLLLILPGIYLALRLSLAFPAIVVDDEGAFDGLRTSWDVARGNLLKLLAITVLSAIVIFSTVLVVRVFSAAFESVAVIALVSAVVTAIVSPIVQLAYARVYLENREPEPTAGAADDWTGDDRATADARGRDDDRDDTHW